MSEQTPGSAANPSDDDALLGADAEPSMEDILASIRKIISDDADPVPLDGPEGTIQESPDSEEGSLDIEAMMGDLDKVEVSAQPPASFADSVGLGDLAPLEEDLAIPDMDASEAKPESSADTAIAMSRDNDGDDDMDQLMNELLSDMDALDDALHDTAAKVDGPVGAAMPAKDAASESTDLEMDEVKSMLADLTDEDVTPAAQTAETDLDAFDMDALMGEIEDLNAETQQSPAPEPDTEPDADKTAAKTDDAEQSDADALDAMEDDIFDSILDMTLDDEVAAFDAAAEAEGTVPSLEDIAAAADAEADVDVAAVAVTAAAVVTTPSDPNTDAAAERDTATAADKPAPSKPAPSKLAPAEMETPMPSALRSDAILDDVTESATMSAFAELNQVVEDKAILSERGPRIGDLVQDALKPMLKEWLDENLQGIVERAVAKEVKRIATGK